MIFFRLKKLIGKSRSNLLEYFQTSPCQELLCITWSLAYPYDQESRYFLPYDQLCHPGSMFFA